jgi:hypothetical protein
LSNPSEWVTSATDLDWPDMPEGVTDRAADVWEPLLAVADLIGGHWVEDARQACLAFVTGSRDDTMSAGVRLLADVRDVFGYHDAVSTAALLSALHALDESPWRDLHGKPLDDRGTGRTTHPGCR